MTKARVIKQIKIISIIILSLLMVIYMPFVTTRYSRYSTCIPFSGKLFLINCEKLEKISLMNGTTGDRVVYKSGSDEFASMVKYLNTFRYNFWVPDIPIKRSGYEYYIGLHWSDTTWTMCLFNDRAIRVRGVWYFGKYDFFDCLKQIVGNNMIEESS